jgi:hypothetical protein
LERSDEHRASRGFSLGALSCPSSTFCTVINSEGSALTYNGTTWSNPTKIGSYSGLFSVSCSSSTFCVAVDASGEALTYNGSAWTTPTTVNPPSGYSGQGANLESVSCVPSGFCAAVGYPGTAVTYNGSGWSSPASIDGKEELISVSCASSTFCAAVDRAGNAIIYNGTGWSSPTSIDPGGGGLVSVSCASSTFCVAVDQTAGMALIYDGSGWSAPATIDPDKSLESVSCPSSTFCVAVNYAAQAFMYDGGSWSAPTTIDNNILESVSCASTTFCAAVDSNGGAVTYDGSGWTAPTTIDSDQGLQSSVSCPSSTFCTAVWEADAVAYRSTGSSSTPVNAGVPSILTSGTVTPGQTLTESHGSWINGPTHYAYQWQDCDTSGGSCAAIPGATGQSYTLQTSDVEHTIRVQETASNAAGASTPATSLATAVVQPPAPPTTTTTTPPPTRTTTPAATTTPPSTTSSPTPVTGGGSQPRLPAGPSSATIRAALRTVLVTSGPSATIAKLLNAGGYSFSFSAPSPGTLVMDWYYVPKGATIARSHKPKAVLVAQVKEHLAKAAKTHVKLKLTGAGRRLLRHVKRETLTARMSFAPTGHAATTITKRITLKR